MIFARVSSSLYLDSQGIVLFVEMQYGKPREFNGFKVRTSLTEIRAYRFLRLTQRDVIIYSVSKTNRYKIFSSEYFSCFNPVVSRDRDDDQPFPCLHSLDVTSHCLSKDLHG